MNDVRTFETGATRSPLGDKWDYEGFLSPAVLDAYAAYMHTNRIQTDGTLRASDNWQKGIPMDSYMSSMFRHFMDVWRQHRGYPGQEPLETSLCALLFNVMGYLHELKREERQWQRRMVENALAKDSFAKDADSPQSTHTCASTVLKSS